mmetsp:Transcript_97960/g.281810  ORF Transcript_97960/g.281810 Transcript_97960/m.281810 type:complete len:213 (+) Transcript_97960:283-921(+)
MWPRLLPACRERPRLRHGSGRRGSHPRRRRRRPGAEAAWCRCHSSERRSCWRRPARVPSAASSPPTSFRPRSVPKKAARSGEGSPSSSIGGTSASSTSAPVVRQRRRLGPWRSCHSRRRTSCVSRHRWAGEPVLERSPGPRLPRANKDAAPAALDAMRRRQRCHSRVPEAAERRQCSCRRRRRRQYPPCLQSGRRKAAPNPQKQQPLLCDRR